MLHRRRKVECAIGPVKEKSLILIYSLPMVMLILIPTNNPKPIAAKNARITSSTPIRVMVTLDATKSKLYRNATEKRAISAREITVSVPPLKVISSNIRPVVPITPASKGTY